MSGPVLVAVDEDAGALQDIERELCDRYARHYRVICMRSPQEALASLEDLAAGDEEVALVLAGQWLTGMTGSDLPSRDLEHVARVGRRAGCLATYDPCGR